ncbi:MAG TPA: DMT family transporter [Candidatus Avacidaminococcus intestinavium]|uniref:DMT family transporter n=1 Tax=Candidatus Avacidaminococcus intestinavium TaxID=2840684 RepID=A0A9D1SLG1_9FIRM|nr:DMT family transporter [Candidatus Avacidaminococcus intestinavium]
MLYYVLAALAGATITTQVGMNTKLLSYLGSPILTAFFSFLVGTLGLGSIYLVAAYYGWQSIPALSVFSGPSLWMWLGGLLGGFYIFTTVFVTPKIGFANMFSLVVAGQIILAVIFDHFGFITGTLHSVTQLRLLGIAFLIIGVYLIQTN